ncbi:hypothetical protein Tco_0774286 [Tanacetum coccineum]|uniref:Uncharacterized protein n=1 Tax=Tanacetum coccineum TaxID=301880 RepID=A0ABQ4ZN65_9ASTR
MFLLFGGGEGSQLEGISSMRRMSQQGHNTLESTSVKLDLLNSKKKSRLLRKGENHCPRMELKSEKKYFGGQLKNPTPRKSTVNWKLSHRYIDVFRAIPDRSEIERPAISSVMQVGVSSEEEGFFHTEYGKINTRDQERPMRACINPGEFTWNKKSSRVSKFFRSIGPFALGLNQLSITLVLEEDNSNRWVLFTFNYSIQYLDIILKNRSLKHLALLLIQELDKVEQWKTGG